MTEKYPRTPLSPWSPGGSERNDTADMRDFAGTAICVTEKLDGSNVALSQGKAIPRSGTLGTPAPWLAMCRKYIAWRTLSQPSLTLYGEDIYGVHTIRYGPVPEDRTFRLFAVLDDDGWASWDRVQQVADTLDIETVPVLFHGQYRDRDRLRERMLSLMQGPSALGGQKEGIIIRRARPFPHAAFPQNVCKMVRSGHVQPDAPHWTRTWTPAPTLPPTGQIS